MGVTLASYYTGPFVTLEELGRGVRCQCDGVNALKQAVNAINLKLWNETGQPGLASEKPFPPGSSSDKPQSWPLASSSDNMAMWIEPFNLTEGDYQLISGGIILWLNHRIIHAINQILGQNMGIEANQSVLLEPSQSGFKAMDTQ